MLLASENVAAEIRVHHIPLLEGALECVRSGYIPAGLRANREFAECAVQFEEGLGEEFKTVLFDPQTAGGLLISVAARESSKLRQMLQQAGVSAAEIGEVVAKDGPLIVVQAEAA